MKEMSKQLVSLSLPNSMVESSSEFAPSVEVVFSNEDLLSEILLRVPVRSLMCQILVSKQWLSLITSNSFSVLHLRRRRTTAIFLHSEYLLRRGSDEHTKFFHVDPDRVDKNKNHQRFLRNPFRTSVFSHDPFDPKRVCTLQFCHGLLLCRTGIPVSNVDKHRGLFYYYVYNPTTNQVVTIDRMWDSKVRIHASLLHYDPAKSPYFKVVFCVDTSGELKSEQRQFEVYTSETGTWKVSDFVPALNLHIGNSTYFQGRIYWICTAKLPNVMFYYDVDKERLATLPRPPRRESLSIRRYLYFGESAGHLHLAEVLQCATSLDVYELNCDRSGWFLKYTVDLTRLAKDFPEMTNNKHTIDDEYAFAVLSLVRREDFDQDSLLVLEIPGKIIVYNLVDQTWKVILNFCQANNTRDWFCGTHRPMDYIESLARVSTGSAC